MNEVSHSQILYASWPNTYLALLPKELKNLLTDYYYGPLELIYYHHAKDQGVLRILKFEGNKLDCSINVTLSVFNLLADYDKNHDHGTILTGDGTTNIVLEVARLRDDGVDQVALVAHQF